MKVYISGPMTGLPELNNPAFFAAEKFLEERGFIVLNPARNPKGLTYEEYLDIGMAMVRASDILYMLEGWEDSPGASAERAYGIAIKREITKQGMWFRGQ